MVSLFSGLIGDLEHARRASLLIEIQRKHIEEIVKEHPTFELKNYCDNIFNQGLPQLKTNVVVIDASNKEQAQLLHAVIGLIEESLKRKKEIDSALNLGLHFATLGLSEFIDGSITDNIANYIDETWDVFQESVSQFFGKKVEEKIVGKAEEGTEQLINSTKVYYQPGTTLYLSKKAKAKLTSLTNKLIKNHSPSESMQFLVELVATLGEDAPKLLVINDPFSLDAESLSFCSLLMSYAKDLKQQGRTLPMSMVFNYTSKQPYDNESKEERNFQPLLRLRHMMQRYDMLEKPDSNIPSPAIKSTTFVGRQEELAQLLRQHDELLEASSKSEDVRISQWTLIKGEPGTGKTALINRHLNELEKLSDDASKSQIRLRLLNQVGHSSQVTGLASLLQSIHAESSRLSQCYKESNGLLSYYIKEKVNTYKKSARDVVSLSEEVLRTKKVTSNEVKKALKAIADIANKEKLYASAEAMYDRTKIKGSATQSADAFTEGGSQNKKQEAFYNLSNALRHLCSIANAVSPVNKKMPLILVIDDLQWVDELSAEYILEHLVGNYSIELLITSRDSDSQASYKVAQAQSEYLPYTIKLFDKANSLVTGSISTFDNKSKKSIEAVTEPIPLEGMDRLTVINLLKATYEIPERLDIDIFGVIADSLIKCLSGNESDENEQVNTLFVIETLNLLSDPAFYRRHRTNYSLFKRSNSGKYCLNVSCEDAFVIRVEEAFKLLEETHEAAYEHDSLSCNGRKSFLLPSYAVMEERLLIIQEYMADYGNTASFSLQLASILGTPFDSNLVKDIILEIRDYYAPDGSTFFPLIKYMNEQNGQYLTPEHLMLLEEVFEILRRVKSPENMHGYKHGLLRAFFLQQFEYKLITLFPKEIRQKSLNDLFELITESLLSTKSAECNFERKLHINSCLLNLHEYAFKIDPQTWFNEYYNSLFYASSYQGQVSNICEAKKLLNMRISIVKEFKSFKNSRDIYWLSNAYSSQLQDLNYEGNFHQAVHVGTEAIKLIDSAMLDCFPISDNRTEVMLRSLNDMKVRIALLTASNCQVIDKFDYAISLENSVKDIIFSARLPSFSRLSLSLNFVDYLQKAKRFDEAIKELTSQLWGESFLESEYGECPDLCESTEISWRSKLAQCYLDNNNYESAIFSFKKLINHLISVETNNFYEMDEYTWANYYFKSLTSISKAYAKIGRASKSQEYIKSAKPKLKLLYEDDKQRWGRLYINFLITQALIYSEIGEHALSKEVASSALSVIGPLHSTNAEYWSKEMNDLIEAFLDIYTSRTRDVQCS